VGPLQVGHLRCLLQMGHQQTLLRQVDGLMARCLGQASAAAAAAAAAAVVGIQGQGQGANQPDQQQQCVAGGGALQAVQWSIGQLAVLGVAGAWRLGVWGQLRGYLSVLEAAGESAAGVLRPLSAADRWEVRGCAADVLYGWCGVLCEWADVLCVACGYCVCLPASGCACCQHTSRRSRENLRVGLHVSTPPQ
jgi:hypothetical protein